MEHDQKGASPCLGSGVARRGQGFADAACEGRFRLGRIKDDVLRRDVGPKGGRQSGPVEEFHEIRQVALAERFLQSPEAGALRSRQVGGMADHQIEVAGVVSGAGDAAPVGPDLLVRQMGGDEPAQFRQMPGWKGERGFSHVFGAAFRRGPGRRAGNR